MTDQMKITKENLYGRQTVLEEIGSTGQERLLESKVAVVGCGGLGNFVSIQLAASGVGSLHLIDYDRVAVSNLHRQVFFCTADVGMMKAERLANHVQRITPFVKTSVCLDPLTKKNIPKELADCDLIVDCTDSLPTKYLLNDFCVLSDKTLVYGSLYKHDGYVSCFNLPEGEGRSANLRDAFANPPKKGIPSCSEVGTLNTIVSLIATLQSNEAIKILTKVGKPLSDKILIYNSMENRQLSMSLTRRFGKREIEKIYATESYFDARCAEQDNDLLISAQQLRERLESVTILSVIDDPAVVHPFEVQHRIPYSQFETQEFHAEEGEDLVVVCKRGITSYQITKRIKSVQPHLRVLSLEGGIDNFQL